MICLFLKARDPQCTSFPVSDLRVHPSSLWVANEKKKTYINEPTAVEGRRDEGERGRDREERGKGCSRLTRATRTSLREVNAEPEASLCVLPYGSGSLEPDQSVGP